jgi:hypothetical protein
VQFVVDTTGRVELPSIRVIESTNVEFESPARESVVAAVPAGAYGSPPVRQLAEQPIRFIVAEQ